MSGSSFRHIWRNAINRKFTDCDGFPQARCPNCRKLHPVMELVMPPAIAREELMAALFKDLQDRGVWHGYSRYVLDLEPILAAMSACGMPVSPARHAEVLADLQARYEEAEAGMQAFVPEEVRPFHPKHGYKKPPVQGDGEYMLKKFPDGERWVKLDKWKPSPAGLIRYMRHKGHAVPRDWKTAKETTNEQELERLARHTKDLLYEAVLGYRQIGTVLNNHMVNWTPSADGRVHPVFYYDTGTGQLASRRPNVQNAPKHGLDVKKKLANAFRSMVIAAPGHTLIEFDHKSFHAQTLAFEAEDGDYLRLAKLDIHSYLTAHLVRHPERDRMLGYDDVSLGTILAEIKKKHGFIRDYKAKRAILGYGFGMGWRKLYMMNRDSFDSHADAKRTVDMLNGLFPKACRWRDAIRAQAHEQGYLLSRFGCIRWFWEVFKWQGGKWAPGGDDSEAAVAFLPANDAFCHIKEAMIRLNGAGLLARYRLINQIHDALMFECPDELVEEALAKVTEEMERPSEFLVNSVAPGGLSVKVGVAMGRKWSEMR